MLSASPNCPPPAPPSLGFILLHELADAQRLADLDLALGLAIGLRLLTGIGADIAHGLALVLVLALGLALGLALLVDAVTNVGEVEAHAVGVLAVGVVLGLGLVGGEAEGVAVEADGGLVADADVKGDVLGAECLDHGELGLAHNLLGDAEAA
ncbi:hypothetical protein BN1708_014082, partial [Verticillium longisporum]